MLNPRLAGLLVVLMLSTTTSSVRADDCGDMATNHYQASAADLGPTDTSTPFAISQRFVFRGKYYNIPGWVLGFTEKTIACGGVTYSSNTDGATNPSGSRLAHILVHQSRNFYSTMGYEQRDYRNGVDYTTGTGAGGGGPGQYAALHPVEIIEPKCLADSQPPNWNGVINEVALSPANNLTWISDGNTWIQFNGPHYANLGYVPTESKCIKGDQQPSWMGSPKEVVYSDTNNITWVSNGQQWTAIYNSP